MGTQDLPERLRKRIAIDPVTGCWNWTGYKCPGGYGRTSLNRHPWPAHRLVYTKLVGPIPDGLTIDHLCRNKPCVNPAHMEPVTAAENIRRAAPFAEHQKHSLRQWKRPASVTTHCPKGHAYDEANTYVRPNGLKECRTCRKAKR